MPIYVVTLARPELIERRPDWGAGQRNFVSLVPRAAARGGDARAARRARARPARRAAVERSSARADGIPLYAVETVRMLVAEGRLGRGGRRLRPVGDLTDLAVPETLTRSSRRASTRSTPPTGAWSRTRPSSARASRSTALAAVCGHAEPTSSSRACARSSGASCSPRRCDPRSPERGQYAFVQALIREVAYDTLAEPDRRTRHLAAARYFEALGEDELAGALAAHYLAAYRASLGGPEAQALAAQARDLTEGAASRAAALGSPDQAASYFLAAVDVTDDPAEAADLL